MSTKPLEDATISRLTRNLQRIASDVMSAKLSSPIALWNLQVQLRKLQIELQQVISAAKEAKAPGQRDHLKVLRELRWHARRVGDAIAWSVLGFNRRILYPLSANTRVGLTSQETDGDRGVLIAAEYLANNGWGFPLLHDITSCLRIGDITFVKGGVDPVTVEVKTKLLESRPADGGQYVEYQIDALMAPDAPLRPGMEGKGRDMSGTINVRTSQLRRLAAARTVQNAPQGVISDIDGEPTIVAEHSVRHGSNMNALQRVVRKARRTGYGAEGVDNTFFYVAIYEPTGALPPDDSPYADNLIKDLEASGVLFESDDGMNTNSLVFFSVPQIDEVFPQLYLPYLLYSLPKSSRIDILLGRMVLLNIVNAGRVAVALQNEGFDVEYANGKNDLSDDSLRVSADIRNSDGVTETFVLSNLAGHIRETVYEFDSLRNLIEIVKFTMDAARAAISQPSSTEE
jgi:hypothetical protein